MTTKTTPIEDIQAGISLMAQAFASFQSGLEKLDLPTLLKAVEATKTEAKSEPKSEKAEVKAEGKAEPKATTKAEPKPAVKTQKEAKPQKEAEPKVEAKTETKEPEVAKVPGEAPSLELIRKIFAQIFLDTSIKGKIMLQAIIEKYNATKISEVNPDQYGALLREAVSAYRDTLEKNHDKEIDAKLEGMNEWLIPF